MLFACILLALICAAALAAIVTIPLVILKIEVAKARHYYQTEPHRSKSAAK
jgi:hypothetical protein